MQHFVTYKKNFDQSNLITFLSFIFFSTLILFSFFLYNNNISFSFYKIFVIFVGFFFIFHRKKSFFYLKEKLLFVPFFMKQIILFFIIYSISSLTYRICAAFLMKDMQDIQHLLKLIFYGLIFDLDAISPLYTFFRLTLLSQIFFLLFLSKKHYLNNLKAFNLLFFILNIVLISIQGYLWGWVPILGRFIDLEIFYVLDVEKIKYHYLFLSIVSVIIIIYSYFYFQKSKYLFGKIWIYLSCFVFFILPPILSYTPVFTHQIQTHIKYASLIDELTGEYSSNPSQKIKSQILFYNPISFIRDNGWQELKRLEFFDTKKTLFPFFQRPNLKINKNEELKIAQSLCSKKENIIDNKYPAFRKISKNTNLSRYPYNIVLIVLESYEPNESDSFETQSKKPLTFFNEIKKDGLYLNQCFANAQASYEGETALSSALPVWGTANSKQNGLYTFSQRKNWFSILKEHNYKTYFLTSWDSETELGLDNKLIYLTKLFKINNIFKTTKIDCYTSPFITAGIEHISNLFDENLSFHNDMLDREIHSNDLKCAESLKLWKHGDKYVHDEFTYEKLYNKMTSMTEPYFLITHTGSSHYNYPIRDGFKPEGEISKEERYYHSLKYADHALRKFFDRIKQHPTYKNTIFVLISDHTAGRNHYSLHDKYHIPALIYAPGIIAAGEINQPTFQCDIGPTILDILNMDGTYTTFGTSAFQKNLPQRGMILPDWDGYLIFVYDPYIAKVDVNKVYEIYNFRQNKERNLINNPNLTNQIHYNHQEFLKTYQLFADNIYGNKLLPSSRSQ